MNNRRPDRATIVYTNLIHRYTKRMRKLTTENTEKYINKNSVRSVNSMVKNPPIVLGGIEASLRRVPHYDFWSNSVRRSLLFDEQS